MSLQKKHFSNQETFLEESQKMQRLYLRILPFWPLAILVLILGFLCGYLYLRYQVPLYVINAKLVVNDDSQEKSANVGDLLKLDTRNISVETEREIEILNSRDLLEKVVMALQLNVQYSQKGFVKSGQYFKNIPVTLILDKPAFIKNIITGEVEILKDKIKFNGVLYPLNEFVDSKFGKIKWIINNDYHKKNGPDKWILSILPVSLSVDIIQRRLSLKPINKQSSIVQMAYVDAIPERGLLILNTLISLYSTSIINYKSRISAHTLSFLDERLQLISEELNGVETSLQLFKTKQGIVDLGAEGTMIFGQLKQTDAKIGELDVQIDVLNQIEKYTIRRNNVPAPIPATLGNVDPVLVSLLNQLYQTEFDLEKLKQTSGSKNPQIDVLEEAILKLKPGINAGIKNLKINFELSRQHLQNDNNKVLSTLGKIPQKERLLIDISRQQSVKNAIYTFLLQKKEESAIAAAAILPNYRVIEKPEFAGLIYPVSAKVYVNSILIAIILIALFIYFIEFANSRLLLRSQIEHDLPEIPVIGELVFEPRNKNISSIVTGAGKRTLIAEQFREIRTNLKYVLANVTEKCKILLVTSSITEEGKSFVAINTAISISLTGAKVIIVDFDLRRPKIGKQAGIFASTGLSNYLINIASINDIITPHPTIQNLSIIPAGTIPPNPSELMGGQKFLDLIIYLKENYDYVIIDSPPIAAVTDAKILAVVAHATLYIVRHNYTSRSFLKLVRECYQRNSMPNINIIFNGVKSKKNLGYGYGKEYGYGYVYGEDINYAKGYKASILNENISRKN